MKKFLVGGAVRDILMGVQPKDYDYVVVGSTPEVMIAKGFRKVGADFPIFLHPETSDEYALARTERKSGDGYKGFICEWEGVSLEEDLSRRDLTINSIAVDGGGNVIDPHNGRSDILHKVLRHTTEAFKEDPLRVLRVARFMARYGGEWTIATETKRLMDNIYISGELKHLTPERVWLETEKALGEKYPSLYFTTLRDYDHLFIDVNNGARAMQRLDHHPELDVFTHQCLVIDYAAKTFGDKEINLACMLHDLGKYPCWVEYGNAYGHEDAGVPLVEAFCDKWKVPNSYKELAIIVCKYHTKIHGCLGRGSNKGMKAKSIMKLFEDTGALRNTDRFIKMLKCCEADAKGRGATKEQQLEFESKPYPQRKYMEDCLNAVVGFKTKELSQKLLSEGKSGVTIGQVIRQKHIKLIREAQNKWKQLID